MLIDNKTANIKQLTTEEIYYFQDKLEYFEESKMLGYFMAWYIDMEWDYSAYYREVYEMLEATMYYDEYHKCWLMK